MVALIFATVILLAPALFAQDTGTVPSSRADEIQSQRLDKSANLRVEQPSQSEKYLLRAKRVISRSHIGIGVGGLGPRAGLAVGSAAEWSNSSDRLQAKVSGTVSTKLFYYAGTGIQVLKPELNDLRFSGEASHSDFPQLNYYGSGPDSSKNDRTDYRREDTLFTLRGELNSHRFLAESCFVGELLLNVGPGTNGSLPSTETVFGPAEAPGVDVQSNYLIPGCSVQLDLRDFKDDPHHGTFAAITYDRYHAQSADRFSFHRLSGVVEEYLPFLNEKRVIFLRGETNFSFHSDDQVVPFYLQSTLGSDTTLRGYPWLRFYDENSLALTAEYRWEILTGFDMALFGDFGKVFNKPSQISLSGLRNSFGFGFRFKYGRAMVARLDTGFSREGVQVWLKFGKLF